MNYDKNSIEIYLTQIMSRRWSLFEGRRLDNFGAYIGMFGI